MRKTADYARRWRAIAIECYAVDADAEGRAVGKANHRGRDGACAVAGRR